MVLLLAFLNIAFASFHFVFLFFIFYWYITEEFGAYNIFESFCSSGGEVKTYVANKAKLYVGMLLY